MRCRLAAGAGITAAMFAPVSNAKPSIIGVAANTVLIQRNCLCNLKMSHVGRAKRSPKGKYGYCTMRILFLQYETPIKGNLGVTELPAGPCKELKLFC
jgi:hypothetical protein